MPEIVAEEWRPVVGYEGLYEVSSQGRVKSLARRLADGRKWSERTLKPWRSTDGYLQASLRRDGRGVAAKVHRLVCEAFHGPAPADKPFALHGNHDPADNRPENLRWGDHVENMQDMVDADRQPRTKGEANGRAKLTEADVRAIQDELLDGATMEAVAAKHGLGIATVGDIANGKTWAHIVSPELQAKLAKRKRPKTLSDEEVLQVFDLVVQGLLQREIAARLGVNQATISRILDGTTPRYVALRAQWIAAQQRTPAESHLQARAEEEM